MSQVTGLVILPQLNAAWVDWPKRLRTREVQVQPIFKEVGQSEQGHLLKKRAQKRRANPTEKTKDKTKRRASSPRKTVASKLTIKTHDKTSKRRASSPWKRGEQAHHQKKDNEKASKLTTVKCQALNHDTWDLDLYRPWKRSIVSVKCQAGAFSSHF